ncbi:MAG TPA: AMP-binding protein [Candidatus Binatia bacterium]|jgi:acyl-CoA synthetase (AMP-forming)/AMP-acid ligase II|nr:AMP-binding protein [Candidatus Binatia bacterium]
MILDVLARHVATRGDRVFLRHEGQAVTYAQFDQLVNRAANALREQQVTPGLRVTLALGSSIEYVVAAFGVLRTGAILNPVNPGLGASELGYILQHCEPQVVVTDAATDATMRALGVPTVLATTLAAHDDVRPVDVRHAPEDFSTLLYTSGTTGRPKGVLFTHGRTGTSGPHFIQALGLTPDDTILSVTPLFHGNAWGSVVTALHAGGAAAFPKTFSASAFWPLVHETGATVVYTLGTVLAMLLTREPSDLEKNNPLRVILGLGSAPIRERIIERFGVQAVLECFGSTDAGVVTIEPLGQPPRAGSCGPPVPGVRLRVVDEAGNDLPPRGVGEIAVDSPARMAAYFRDPEATAEALRDDWFWSGDLGYLDEDGWLYFVDRKRDVIRRGGENVSSVLVEKTIREHPSVVDVAVIGVPEPVLGQEIKAFVVTKEPVTAEELQAFASARLAKFQVPRLWEFRESLPKTPTQRVEKYKLREGAGRPLLG